MMTTNVVRSSDTIVIVPPTTLDQAPTHHTAVCINYICRNSNPKIEITLLSQLKNSTTLNLTTPTTMTAEETITTPTS